MVAIMGKITTDSCLRQVNASKQDYSLNCFEEDKLNLSLLIAEAGSLLAKTVRIEQMK